MELHQSSSTSISLFVRSFSLCTLCFFFFSVKQSLHESVLLLVLRFLTGNFRPFRPSHHFSLCIINDSYVFKIKAFIIYMSVSSV